MTIYTIGFTKRRAESFFEPLREHGVKLLLDIRLRNESQLAGFTKGKDLEYFSKNLISCEYAHDVTFAPTVELLDAYKRKECNWEEYVSIYQRILESRNAVKHFFSTYGNQDRICLLCSEFKPDQCHRRLLAEHLQAHKEGIQIIHL